MSIHSNHFDRAIDPHGLERAMRETAEGGELLGRSEELPAVVLLVQRAEKHRIAMLEFKRIGDMQSAYKAKAAVAKCIAELRHDLDLCDNGLEIDCPAPEPKDSDLFEKGHQIGARPAGWVVSEMQAQIDAGMKQLHDQIALATIPKEGANSNLSGIAAWLPESKVPPPLKVGDRVRVKRPRESGVWTLGTIVKIAGAACWLNEIDSVPFTDSSLERI